MQMLHTQVHGDKHADAAHTHTFMWTNMQMLHTHRGMHALLFGPAHGKETYIPVLRTAQRT